MVGPRECDDRIGLLRLPQKLVARTAFPRLHPSKRKPMVADARIVRNGNAVFPSGLQHFRKRRRPHSVKRVPLDFPVDKHFRRGRWIARHREQILSRFDGFYPRVPFDCEISILNALRERFPVDALAGTSRVTEHRRLVGDASLVMIPTSLPRGEGIGHVLLVPGANHGLFDIVGPCAIGI